MPTITADSLLTLEAYAKARKDFRATVMAHKKKRSVPLGEHVTLLFEDELTIRYQVQEMLRVERIFEPAGIQDELDTYNPLVPDGSNLKATMLIEYGDVDERKRMLSELKGVERQVWIQVEGCAKVHAIADEDLERETDAKTSAVHFLRFEVTPEMKAVLCRGGQLAVGVTHPAYEFTVAALPPATRDALASDLR